MLEVKNLVKSYGNIKALKNVSFQAGAGKVTALLARNGAGKSTTISIISGLLQEDQGQVMFDGKPTAANLRQKHLGVAAQDLGIYPGLSVIDNLRFFGELQRIKPKEVRHRVLDVCERLNLTSLLNRRANQLSGGQKRRLHTAIALVHRPRVVLLDEPTVGADPHARNDIIDAVNTLANEGVTVLYTSHYFPEIEALNADLVIMEQGRVVRCDSIEALKTEFSQDYCIIDFNSDVAVQASHALPQSHVIHQQSLKVDLHQSSLSFSEILSKLHQYSDNIRQLRHERSDLEQIFLNLTQPYEKPTNV